MLSGSKSFRTRLVLAAAATVVLVQLLGAFVEIYAGYERLNAEMNEKGGLLVHQTAVSIAQPLWDFDDNVVAETLRSLLIIDEFVRASIFSLDGTATTELLPDHAHDKEQSRVYKRPIFITDGSNTEQLGTLEIVLSTHGLTAALRELILAKSLLVLVTLGLASAALFVVLGFISKPLEDLKRAIAAIENEDFDTPVPSLQRTDEIGALANALDGLRERESELAILRRDHNEKSRREGRRILHALHSTQDVVVLIDENDEVIFANASAKAFFPEFVIGLGLVKRKRDANSDIFSIHSALLSQTEIKVEISVEHQDGTRHFQARTGPIIDAMGTYLGGLFLASDFTEQFQHSKNASYLASHDPLTGLLNRRQMDEALSDWMGDSKNQIGMMLLDLDHFKAINDTYGHQDGDALLILVAEQFNKLCGESEQIIRLGGDEFAIISRSHNSEDQLAWIAEGVLDGFAKPAKIGGRGIQISLSAGIATTLTAGRDVKTLMQHADIALYEAKAAGRGRFEIYKDALLNTHERQRAIEDRFLSAIETDGIFLVYQAQTSIHDGGIVGFESLARWNDPDMGSISPIEFIPLAETTDLIEPLTRKLMMDACNTAVAWQANGFQHRIAVNISPRLFNGVVVDLVQDCLKITGCPAEHIELEITETVLLPNLEMVKNEIDTLRSLGLTVAIDDFGIGYSSLDYLRKYPVDKIKIDRAFVKEIATSDQSRAIVTAIAQLGHSLDMKVTGEGAETIEDRNALKGCGVDVIQGFVDGRPATKAEAEKIYLSGIYLKETG